jgi:hypothetical protein
MWFFDGLIFTLKNAPGIQDLFFGVRLKGKTASQAGLEVELCVVSGRRRGGLRSWRWSGAKGF